MVAAGQAGNKDLWKIDQSFNSKGQEESFSFNTKLHEACVSG